LQSVCDTPLTTIYSFFIEFSCGFKEKRLTLSCFFVKFVNLNIYAYDNNLIDSEIETQQAFLYNEFLRINYINLICITLNKILYEFL